MFEASCLAVFFIHASMIVKGKNSKGNLDSWSVITCDHLWTKSREVAHFAISCQYFSFFQKGLFIFIKSFRNSICFLNFQKSVQQHTLFPINHTCLDALYFTGMNYLIYLYITTCCYLILRD